MTEKLRILLIYLFGLIAGPIALFLSYAYQNPFQIIKIEYKIIEITAYAILFSSWGIFIYNYERD